MYITDNAIVDYVKRNLGFPVAVLEISDSDILHVAKTYTLPFFSQYVPDKTQVFVTNQNLVPGSSNVFEIPDPDESAILDVVAVIGNVVYEYPQSMMFMPSDPATFVQGLTVWEAKQLYSQTWISYQFIPPNMVRIYPNTNMHPDFIVRYTRQHASWSTIPVFYHRDFLDLCLSDILAQVGAARTKYSQYSTPFGEISLNGDSLLSRSTELRDRIVEHIKRRPPDTVVYVR